MPFKPINVQERIAEKVAKDSEFKEAWENRRNEYKLLRDITRIRKEKISVVRKKA